MTRIASLLAVAPVALEPLFVMAAALVLPVATVWALWALMDKRRKP